MKNSLVSKTIFSTIVVIFGFTSSYGVSKTILNFSEFKTEFDKGVEIHKSYTEYRVMQNLDTEKYLNRHN